ncbi:MAG: hypothetical protein P8H69_10225 [Planktomarina sp.]|nr:hypothetical protein [Planktomarina sp.]MDG1746134.1 hypothetical protein [Planktomarina sp.]
MNGKHDQTLKRAATASRGQRVTDSALILPLVGIILFLLPIMWPRSSDLDPVAGTVTSTALIYLFVVWAGLICCALGLAFVIKRFGVGRR